MTFHSGFVAIVGRPNTGKSTLVNALVGEKVAITSDKPQTTRHTIRGIVHRDNGQIVLVDTPGIHRPRTLLGQRLNELVRETYADVDLIVMCLPADQPIGPGDRMIAAELAEMRRTPKVAVLTKIDKLTKPKLAARLMELQELAQAHSWQWAQIVPVSALKHDNLDALVDVLIAELPEGPQLFGADAVTDEELETRIAELIREAALVDVREELPHSIAVVVDEMVEREGRAITDIFASLYVERDSQKAIVIGKGGSRLKAVGAAARQQIEALIGRKVMLDLRVKVASEWQRDPKQLGQLGF